MKPLPVTLPQSEHGLHYTTPATTWDEALPLGNGIMGALVWGDGAPLKISLDRADLWDVRPIPIFETSPDYTHDQLVRWRNEGNLDSIKRLYDEPYEKLTAPTKIPAGRLELNWDEAPRFGKADLDVRGARADVRFANEIVVSTLMHAVQPIGLMTVSGGRGPSVRLIAPSFSGVGRAGGPRDGGDFGDLASLGYAAPDETAGDNFCAFTQKGWGEFSFAVYAGWKQEGVIWRMAWSVASSYEGKDPLQIARLRVEKALVASSQTLVASHEKWWDKYWRQSSLTLPNKMLERQWYLEQYKFGSASRRGAPPITLQGPWTADDGKLPPWKGDYHNDLNTQLSYWPCYSANHLEEGLSFLDWLWKVRPENKKWTKKWFGVEGLNVPGVADLEGKQMSGWAQYSFSATTSAWLSQHFYWHWRYSQDRTFLRDRAYPYLADCSTFIEAMTRQKDAQGKRTLALSSSPEINDNRLDAWFAGITNYDLSLMRWLLGATAELADEQKMPAEAARWRAVLAELPELVLAEDGRLLVAPGYPLRESHRHLSWLMAIYPLGLVDKNDGDAAKRTIDASLAELDKFGPAWWCGYSYAWQGNLKARAGDGAGAEKALEIFSKAFTLRNSFHANGDQTKSGLSNYTYRPFTLEGNFAAANGIQQMLLQSQRGLMQVFPAVPDSWQDVSFSQLRTEGAFLVSARREGGKTVQVDIESEKGGVLRLISPFSGKLLTLSMKLNQRLTATSDAHLRGD